MKFKKVILVSENSIVLQTEDDKYSFINKTMLVLEDEIECGKMEQYESYMKFCPYDNFKEPTEKENNDILKLLETKNIIIH